MEKKEQEIDELKSKIASYEKQLDIAIKTGNVEDKILLVILSSLEQII